jgi:hypothetical protein
LSDLPSNLFVKCECVTFIIHVAYYIGYYTDYRAALHEKKTSDSSLVSDILALRGRVISPLYENTLSTEAEVTSTQKMLANSGRSIGGFGGGGLGG